MLKPQLAMKTNVLKQVLTKRFKHHAASDTGIMIMVYNLHRILNVVRLEEFWKCAKELTKGTNLAILDLLNRFGDFGSLVFQFHQKIVFCNTPQHSGGYLNKLGI